MYLYSSLRERSEEIEIEMIKKELEGIYFKALAPAVMGAGKSEICRAGQQYGDAREEPMSQFKFESIWKPFPPLQRTSVFS